MPQCDMLVFHTASAAVADYSCLCDIQRLTAMLLRHICILKHEQALWCLDCSATMLQACQTRPLCLQLLALLFVDLLLRLCHRLLGKNTLRFQVGCAYALCRLQAYFACYTQYRQHAHAVTAYSHAACNSACKLPLATACCATHNKDLARMHLKSITPPATIAQLCSALCLQGLNASFPATCKACRWGSTRPQSAYPAPHMFILCCTLR